ncbi:hypothetical protein [Coleofasciculus sp. G2-EDA-02]|uniref:hypothetical protein n=1 Tax=Coleofasciculus sp. G2-EDA-02 TaxID=3069529 RepID=UPI0032FEA852
MPFLLRYFQVSEKKNLNIPFTPNDLEWVQATFDDYGMELRGCRINIMSPCIVNCGGMASAIARSNFGFALMNWVKTGSDHPLGYVLGRCGWILPNGDVIEPDNCFILTAAKQGLNVKSIPQF